MKHSRGDLYFSSTIADSRNAMKSVTLVLVMMISILVASTSHDRADGFISRAQNSKISSIQKCISKTLASLAEGDAICEKSPSPHHSSQDGDCNDAASCVHVYLVARPIAVKPSLNLESRFATDVTVNDCPTSLGLIRPPISV